MAEIATVARPYAEAAFRAALDKSSLDKVGEGLALLAVVAGDGRVRSFMSDPRVNAKQKKDFFGSIGGERLDDITRNLVGVLVDNGREDILGAIAGEFDALRREVDAKAHAQMLDQLKAQI